MSLEIFSMNKISKDDNNNNVINQMSSLSINGLEKRKFVERHLFILDKEFLVIPNGGSGDCMFKAVCQALNKGDELNHTEVRQKVVNFIVTSRWEKFKESIEVQHIHGNKHLLQNWNLDPVKTYQEYMTDTGTLGSSSELNAAGELFKYNFATIQEYSASSGKIYRIENCCHFSHEAVPFNYFFFTGDYDNGHWECLERLGSAGDFPTCAAFVPIPDGIYPGCIKILIHGNEISLDSWLKIHTENTNEAFHVKHTHIRSPFRETPFPFEWEAFEFASDGSVWLDNNAYRITKTTHTDLFTVLTSIIYDEPKDNSVDQLEDQILDYRLANYVNLNYKLITQPHSHRFTVDNCRYLSLPCKGNIQDLLSAADLYSFSFQIFMKPAHSHPIKSVKFTHVDRWGGETDKMLYFFMRVVSSGEENKEIIYSKWWHLTPIDEIASNEATIDRNCNNQVGDNFSDQYQQINKDSPDTEGFVELHRGNNNSNSISTSSVKHENLNGTEGNKKSNYNNDYQNQKTIHSSSRVGKHKPVIAKSSYSKIQGSVQVNAGNLKTVVEMFDEKSGRRKKYVYDGYLEKENVLKALSQQGYIKQPGSKENVKVTTKESSSGTIKDIAKLRPSTKSSVSTAITSIQNERLSSLLSNNMLPENTENGDLNLNVNVESIDIKSKESSVFMFAKKSVSVIALADKESMERNSKFMSLHQRVAPSEKRKVKKQKNCLRSLFSWAFKK